MLAGGRGAEYPETAAAVPKWQPVSEDMPTDPVLLWSGGRYIVGCAVTGISQGLHWRIFMDARSDELVAEPTHWMPLPPPPEGTELRPDPIRGFS